MTRASKVSIEDFSNPPRPGASIKSLLESFPNILAGSEFRSIVAAIVEAHQNGNPVILGMGAHVVKCGLSPIVIALMERGIITSVAMNGSAAVHDCEIALAGHTSEDVVDALEDGTFGMAKETADLINGAANKVFAQDQSIGLGRLLGNSLLDTDSEFLAFSILATAGRLEIPATVHVAIGTDIVHMHPSARGDAIGEATFRDFRIFAALIGEIRGGIYINAGSAVLLPEIFLKAVSICTNIGTDINGFTTVDIDMISHYRPLENVVRRPSVLGAKGYSLLGRHEILFPLLAHALLDELT